MSDPAALNNRTSQRDWAWWVATLAGLGCLPLMPGTIGSVVGCGIWALTTWLPWSFVWHFALAVLLLLIGGVASTHTERLLGTHDPRVVIIDECVGALFVFLGHSWSLPTALLGLATFRFFDILKPFPIARLQRLPRGWGIMIDDLGAALAAACVLRIAWWFVHKLF
ncbi:MAG: phosphatidylglycerophosphatase A [bacterium]|nr:phosphatidylglycerophosphatase A [bacterium]